MGRISPQSVKRPSLLQQHLTFVELFDSFIQISPGFDISHTGNRWGSNKLWPSTSFANWRNFLHSLKICSSRCVSLPVTARGVEDDLPVLVTKFRQRRGQFAECCSIPDFGDIWLFPGAKRRRIHKPMKPRQTTDIPLQDEPDGD